ncbi:asparaginase [Ilumatobacter nonamiensis]|uniref:asparaginase n=1 Tax=Ilumatobacter nonamiensis TaxID=467093 RepID=UPI000346AD2C|nr:asparaginase [Ilumatobacter nonamiensis]
MCLTEHPRFSADSFAPVAVATRNGVDESLHLGAGVLLAIDGSVANSVGDPDLAVYPRSALKPFQAAAMVRAGLVLPPRLLAVACASHSGERQHLDAVAEILDLHGLTENDLANTPDRPYGADARRAAAAAGIAPSSIQQNCSGKHAAMLATCRINDWPTETYLDADHPLQVAIHAETDRLTGRPGGSVSHVGVDGCGAPTHLMPIVDVARAFRTLVREDSAVVRAMRAEPGLVGGTGRDVSLWMRAVPGLIAKEGASGVMALATADGRAAALKVADGSEPVRRAVTVEMLRALDVDVDGDLSGVRDEVTVRVTGHGVEVGRIMPLAWATAGS